MGITGLLPALKSVTQTRFLRDFEGQTIAVDGYCWLHRGCYSCCYELCTGQPSDRFVSFFVQCARRLIECGIKVVIVFDGDYLPSKKETEKQRQENRERALEDGRRFESMGDRAQMLRCYARAVDVSTRMANEVSVRMKQLFQSPEQIEIIVAPYEADAQLAFLARSGYVDAVLTEDSDLLAYGTPVCLFKFSRDSSTVQTVRYDELKNNDSCVGKSKKMDLRRWDWSSESSSSSLSSSSSSSSSSKSGKSTKRSAVNRRLFSHMFVELCILSGCDYLGSIEGMGLARAYTAIDKHRSYKQVLRKLRFEGRMRVPANYHRGFEQAKMTFLYQTVFDPIHKVLTSVNPMPESVKLQMQHGDLDFLGQRYSDELAVRIADCEIDPISKEPFRKTRLCSLRSDSVASGTASLPPILNASGWHSKRKGSDVIGSQNVMKKGGNARKRGMKAHQNMDRNQLSMHQFLKRKSIGKDNGGGGSSHRGRSLFSEIGSKESRMRVSIKERGMDKDQNRKGTSWVDDGREADSGWRLPERHVRMLESNWESEEQGIDKDREQDGDDEEEEEEESDLPPLPPPSSVKKKPKMDERNTKDRRKEKEQNGDDGDGDERAEYHIASIHGSPAESDHHSGAGFVASPSDGIPQYWNHPDFGEVSQGLGLESGELNRYPRSQKFSETQVRTPLSKTKLMNEVRRHHRMNELMNLEKKNTNPKKTATKCSPTKRKRRLDDMMDEFGYDENDDRSAHIERDQQELDGYRSSSEDLNYLTGRQRKRRKSRKDSQNSQKKLSQLRDAFSQSARARGHCGRTVKKRGHSYSHSSCSSHSCSASSSSSQRRFLSNAPPPPRLALPSSSSSMGGIGRMNANGHYHMDHYRGSQLGGTMYHSNDIAGESVSDSSPMSRVNRIFRDVMHSPANVITTLPSRIRMKSRVSSLDPTLQYSYDENIDHYSSHSRSQERTMNSRSIRNEKDSYSPVLSGKNNKAVITIDLTQTNESDEKAALTEDEGERQIEDEHSDSLSDDRLVVDFDAIVDTAESPPDLTNVSKKEGNNVDKRRRSTVERRMSDGVESVESATDSEHRWLSGIARQKTKQGSRTVTRPPRAKLLLHTLFSDESNRAVSPLSRSSLALMHSGKQKKNQKGKKMSSVEER